MSVLQRIAASHAPSAVVLIRLMVGSVFLSEGLQKFLFPEDPDRGAARFAKLGFPAPEFTSLFVACFEVTCGAFVLLGLLTRLAVTPLLAIMVVAIITTKVPIVLTRGFWDMAHAARTDVSMLLGSLFLLCVGAGRWSADARLFQWPAEQHSGDRCG